MTVSSSESTDRKKMMIPRKGTRSSNRSSNSSSRTTRSSIRSSSINFNGSTSTNVNNNPSTTTTTPTSTTTTTPTSPLLPTTTTTTATTKVGLQHLPRDIWSSTLLKFLDFHVDVPHLVQVCHALYQTLDQEGVYETWARQMYPSSLLLHMHQQPHQQPHQQEEGTWSQHDDDNDEKEETTTTRHRDRPYYSTWKALVIDHNSHAGVLVRRLVDRGFQARRRYKVLLRSTLLWDRHAHQIICKLEVDHELKRPLNQRGRGALIRTTYDALRSTKVTRTTTTKTTTPLGTATSTWTNDVASSSAAAAAAEDHVAMVAAAAAAAAASAAAPSTTSTSTFLTPVGRKPPPAGAVASRTRSKQQQELQRQQRQQTFQQEGVVSGNGATMACAAAAAAAAAAAGSSSGTAASMNNSSTTTASTTTTTLKPIHKYLETLEKSSTQVRHVFLLVFHEDDFVPNCDYALDYPFGRSPKVWLEASQFQGPALRHDLFALEEQAVPQHYDPSSSSSSSSSFGLMSRTIQKQQQQQLSTLALSAVQNTGMPTARMVPRDGTLHKSWKLRYTRSSSIGGIGGVLGGNGARGNVGGGDMPALPEPQGRHQGQPQRQNDVVAVAAAAAAAGLDAPQQHQEHLQVENMEIDPQGEHRRREEDAVGQVVANVLGAAGMAMPRAAAEAAAAGGGGDADRAVPAQDQQQRQPPLAAAAAAAAANGVDGNDNNNNDDTEENGEMVRYVVSPNLPPLRPLLHIGRGQEGARLFHVEPPRQVVAGAAVVPVPFLDGHDGAQDAHPPRQVPRLFGNNGNGGGVVAAADPNVAAMNNNNNNGETSGSNDNNNNADVDPEEHALIPFAGGRIRVQRFAVQPVVHDFFRAAAQAAVRGVAGAADGGAAGGGANGAAAGGGVGEAGAAGGANDGDNDGDEHGRRRARRAMLLRLQLARPHAHGRQRAAAAAVAANAGQQQQHQDRQNNAAPAQPPQGHLLDRRWRQPGDDAADLMLPGQLAQLIPGLGGRLFLRAAGARQAQAVGDAAVADNNNVVVQERAAAALPNVPQAGLVRFADDAQIVPFAEVAPPHRVPFAEVAPPNRVAEVRERRRRNLPARAAARGARRRIARVFGVARAEHLQRGRRGLDLADDLEAADHRVVQANIPLDAGRLAPPAAAVGGAGEDFAARRAAREFQRIHGRMEGHLGDRVAVARGQALELRQIEQEVERERQRNVQLRTRLAELQAQVRQLERRRVERREQRQGQENQHDQQPPAPPQQPAQQE